MRLLLEYKVLFFYCIHTNKSFVICFLCPAKDEEHLVLKLELLHKVWKLEYDNVFE